LKSQCFPALPLVAVSLCTIPCKRSILDHISGKNPVPWYTARPTQMPAWNQSWHMVRHGTACSVVCAAALSHCALPHGVATQPDPTTQGSRPCASAPPPLPCKNHLNPDSPKPHLPSPPLEPQLLIPLCGINISCQQIVKGWGLGIANIQKGQTGTSTQGCILRGLGIKQQHHSSPLAFYPEKKILDFS